MTTFSTIHIFHIKITIFLLKITTLSIFTKIATKSIDKHDKILNINYSMWPTQEFYINLNNLNKLTWKLKKIKNGERRGRGGRNQQVEGKGRERMEVEGRGVARKKKGKRKKAGQQRGKRGERSGTRRRWGVFIEPPTCIQHHSDIVLSQAGTHMTRMGRTVVSLSEHHSTAHAQGEIHMCTTPWFWYLSAMTLSARTRKTRDKRLGT